MTNILKQTIDVNRLYILEKVKNSEKQKWRTIDEENEIMYHENIEAYRWNMLNMEYTEPFHRAAFNLINETLHKTPLKKSLLSENWFPLC